MASYGESNGTPLLYSCLENPMDGGAWWAAVHGVAKSQTRLSVFPFPFHFHALEKEMATHSSVLAWRIPWTEEHGGLQSIGLQRVRHDWSDLACTHPILELFPFHQITLANIAPLKPSGKSYKQVKWLACQQTRGPKYRKDHKTCPRLCRTKI